jgi:hypothetical protein
VSSHASPPAGSRTLLIGPAAGGGTASSWNGQPRGRGNSVSDSWPVVVSVIDGIPRIYVDECIPVTLTVINRKHIVQLPIGRRRSPGVRYSCI